MGSMVDFARPDGGKTKGFLALADAGAGGERPSIIVIQEWWGLNDQICGIADRFARAGILAPGAHDEHIVDRGADDIIHTLAFQLVELVDKAGKVFCRTGRGECARHGEQGDRFAAEDVCRCAWRRAICRHFHESCVRKFITDLDAHLLFSLQV